MSAISPETSFRRLRTDETPPRVGTYLVRHSGFAQALEERIKGLTTRMRNYDHEFP